MLTDDRIATTPQAGTGFAELRAREFARLDASAHTYLDHTGSALYPASLVSDHAAMLHGAVLGNPHAESPASLASSALLAAARARVLGFFEADPAEYGVVFTANATGAVRLVGEGFRFGARAPLVLAQDDHNSVNGIREYARRAGAAVLYLPLDADLRLVDAPEQLEALGTGGLLAFPAQSNFAGVRHPLSLVGEAQALGYTVLLDAAAYVPTSPLSLRDVPADFVALSFYKMFGYPTGLGALVARHDALDALRRPWFAGGTVDFVSVHHDAHRLKRGVEAFEDGTPSFLAAAAASAGLDFLDGVGLRRIQRHTTALADSLATALVALRRRDGGPLVTLYGPADGRDRGATIAFNVLDGRGRAVPYCRVEERAREARVSVRGGCFCNPGAAAAAFGFPRDATIRCLDAARDGGWSLDRFAECLGGGPVGAVRASLGMSSSAADVERLVEVVAGFR